MSLKDLRPYLDLPGLCPNPVFVIGSPRSGTTALAQSLNRHPELRVGKESYLLHDLFGARQAEGSWDRHTHRVTPSWLAFEKVERAELLGFLGLGINALFSSRADGKRWIDQTPRYTPMAETLAQMFPGAQFLHIVRDGRHVVRSMVNFERKFDAETIEAAQPNEIPAWSHDFDQGCETWMNWVAAALDFGEAHPDRCLRIQNEELSADPAAGFDSILRFLGLEHHPGPAKFFGKQRINSSWVRDPTRPEDEDWEGWDPERRQRFLELTTPVMLRAGYGPEQALLDWADG